MSMGHKYIASDAKEYVMYFFLSFFLLYLFFSLLFWFLLYLSSLFLFFFYFFCVGSFIPFFGFSIFCVCVCIYFVFFLSIFVSFFQLSSCLFFFVIRTFLTQKQKIKSFIWKVPAWVLQHKAHSIIRVFTSKQ